MGENEAGKPFARKYGQVGRDQDQEADEVGRVPPGLRAGV